MGEKGLWLMNVIYALISVAPIIMIRLGAIEKTWQSVLLAALIFLTGLIGMMLIDSKQTRM